MSEVPAERARKYISSFEANLERHDLVKEDASVEASAVGRVSDTLSRYLQDAKFYLKNGKPTTSLASIAYAEGLLDAFVFLGLAKMRTIE